MNAQRSPARIGEAHLTDQIPNFIECRGSSFKMATLPCPIESKPQFWPGEDQLHGKRALCSCHSELPGA